jgi:hypothetical protein
MMAGFFNAQTNMRLQVLPASIYDDTGKFDAQT